MSSFLGFALTRSEMKNVVGGGCGATCYQKGSSIGEMCADYGKRTKKSVKSMAKSCAEAGGTGYWCCASC